MDCHRIYAEIIDRARGRVLTGYSESHHVVPRCLGGGDDHENLVDLTPEEHFVAHLLLTRMHPQHRGLIWAAMKMSLAVGERPRRRIYGWVRRRHSEAMKLSSSGDGNTQFGTRWITDGISSLKIRADDDVPLGWSYGRVWKRRILKVTNCQACGVPTGNRKRMFCEEHFKDYFAKRDYSSFDAAARESYKGRIFITNGVQDKTHSTDMPIPAGWRRGRSNNGKAKRILSI